MSQAKVEKHKQEKYGRKNTPKQSKFKKYLAYAGATLVAAALIIYMGYSVAIETGLYKPEEKTTAYVGTASVKDLKSKLATSGDPIGLYDTETTAAAETTAAEETTAAK